MEIETQAKGSAGYAAKVTELTIAGRQIDPATVEGLDELLTRRNLLQPVGGYCDYQAEVFVIEELAGGPKAGEAGRRIFRIPYSPSP
jgi:hypothetical protein